MIKRTQINQILLALIMLIGVILIAVIYLTAFHQNPPIEFYNLPFPTDKTEYSVGDNIILTAEYCRYTEVFYISHLAFVDGLRFSVPERVRPGANAGCKTVDFVILEIPENLPPGEYYLSGKNEYQVNFLSNRLVEWTSQPFTVK